MGEDTGFPTEALAKPPRKLSYHSHRSVWMETPSQPNLMHRLPSPITDKLSTWKTQGKLNCERGGFQFWLASPLVFEQNPEDSLNPGKSWCSDSNRWKRYQVKKKKEIKKKPKQTAESARVVSLLQIVKGHFFFLVMRVLVERPGQQRALRIETVTS